MKKIIKVSENKNTELIIDSDFSLINKSLAGGFLLIDENVEMLYQDKINFSNLAIKISLAASETVKSISSYQLIVEELIKNKIRRDSILIAIGGGTIGDIAGFIAATMFRGIKFIQIPTTLLAMTDSALGGKCGINFNNVKNVLGSFYAADKIIVNPEFLNTLSKKDYKSGLAEVLKYGFIYDKRILDDLKNDRSIDLVINKCLNAKAEITTEDYRDNGKRQILNFGHTFGHALEAYSKYEISHGEAVLSGMEIAFKIGIKLNLTPSYLLEEFHNLCEKLQLSIVKMPVNEVVSFLSYDKKNLSNKISYILVSNLGESVIKQLKLVELIKLAEAV
ncbi:MAG: 3-dehydroquinate synthase [Erysipelotrichales bacterium]|nr:3-dehydroquinate synthase [Erysipelotrichales bacterium]